MTNVQAIRDCIKENNIPQEYCCDCEDDCTSDSCICAQFNRLFNNDLNFGTQYALMPGQ